MDPSSPRHNLDPADFHFEVMQWIELEIEYLDKQIDYEEMSEERSRFD